MLRFRMRQLRGGLVLRGAEPLPTFALIQQWVRGRATSFVRNVDAHPIFLCLATGIAFAFKLQVRRSSHGKVSPAAFAFNMSEKRDLH
jgi:hypothetical protein